MIRLVKSYLCEDAIFLIVWVKKVTYWYYEKKVSKELVMTKEDDKDSQNY